MNLSRFQRFLLFSWNFPKLILLLVVYFYLELQQPSAPIKIPVVLSLPLQVRCKQTQTSFNQIYFNANRIFSSSSSRHHRLPSPGPPPKYRKHSESPIAVERFRYSQSHSPVLKNGGHRNGHRSRTPESRMIEHRRNRSPSKAPVSSSAKASIEPSLISESTGTFAGSRSIWSPCPYIRRRDPRYFRALRSHR